MSFPLTPPSKPTHPSPARAAPFRVRGPGIGRRAAGTEAALAAAGQLEVGAREVRVIGLGNPILSDDGVGLHVVRALAERLPRHKGLAEIVEAEVAGFSLLELLQGARRIILVDAITRSDVEPGTALRLAPDDFATTPRLRSVHEIDLPTVVGLGRALGLAMPEEIVIFAVQAADMRTFGERLTPAVAVAVPGIVERIVAQLEAWERASDHDQP